MAHTNDALDKTWKLNKSTPSTAPHTHTPHNSHFPPSYTPPCHMMYYLSRFCPVNKICTLNFILLTMQNVFKRVIYYYHIHFIVEKGQDVFFLKIFSTLHGQRACAPQNREPSGRICSQALRRSVGGQHCSTFTTPKPQSLTQQFTVPGPYTLPGDSTSPDAAFTH